MPEILLVLIVVIAAFMLALGVSEAVAIGLVLAVGLLALLWIVDHFTRRAAPGWRPDESCPSPHACRRECIHNGCRIFASLNGMK